MKMAWDVAPCRLAELDGLRDRLDDGGGRHVSNVNQVLPDYTPQQPRSQPFKLIFSDL